MDAIDYDALAAAILRAQAAPAPAPVPAVSAPAQARVLSPFETLGITGRASADGVPTDMSAAMQAAWRAGAPEKRAQEFARMQARIDREPRHTCTVDVTDHGVTIAKHGYWRPLTTGDPCKATGCDGKVR